MGNARFGCAIALIDMHAGHGSLEEICRSGTVLGSLADCVIEDKDTCGSSSVMAVVSDGQMARSKWHHSRVLQQLLNFWVVLCFDLVIVDEVLLNAGMTVDLESVLVKVVILLLASDIGNGHIQRFGRSLVCLWLANVRGLWWAAITRILVVVQSCLNMMLLSLSGRRISKLCRQWLE